MGPGGNLSGAKSRTGRLKRLVKLKRMLYEIETSALALASADAAEATEVANSAASYLDAEPQSANFLAELAVARAARARRLLTEAEDALRAQVETAVDVKTRLLGAENRLDAANEATDRAQAARVLEDVLERGAAPKASPRQGRMLK